MSRLKMNSVSSGTRDHWDRDTWILFLLVALIWVAQCFPVRAQTLDEPCAPQVTQNRRTSLEVNGDAGFWFHTDVARCMLQRLTLLPQLNERVNLQEQRFSLVDERLSIEQERVTLAVQEAERATGALTAAVRGRREAQEALDAWYRAPALWVAVGVVLAVVLEVVAVYAINTVGGT